MDSWIWCAVAAALFVIEMTMPGYFLIFPAIGAAIVGLGGLFGVATLEAQLVLFAAASALLFAVTFRRYRDLTARGSVLSVNSPERLLGRTGTVEDPFSAGCGKIRLGDSVWLARGPDMARGTPVRIAGVDGTVLLVRPLD